MRLYGLGADIESIGDFLGVIALRNQLQDLALARRQHLHRRAVQCDFLHVKIERLLGNMRIEVLPAMDHFDERLFQLIGGRILEQITVGAGIQGLHDVFFATIHRQHQELDGRMVGAQPPHGFEAIHAFHGDVHHHHIGLVLFGQFDGGVAVIGLTHHFYSRHRREQRPDTAAHKRVVVRQQDSCQHVQTLRMTGVTGNCKTISTPLPGAEAISMVPPTSTARSSILSNPKLVPEMALLRAVSMSKPLPSSRMLTFNWSWRWLTLTQMFSALAWRRMLVTASCTMRKQVFSMSWCNSTDSGELSNQPFTLASVALFST